jgi:hypothetical protein
MANNDKIFNIVKNIATLSDNGNVTKEFNLIKYKDLTHNILDIRKWDNNGTDKKMLKGITLTETEAKTLRDALNEYFKEDAKA